MALNIWLQPLRRTGNLQLATWGKAVEADSTQMERYDGISVVRSGRRLRV